MRSTGLHVKRNLKTAMQILTLSLATTGIAHAYIDPGTGSMLLQMGGAAIAAGFFYLRSVRTWLVGLFRNNGAAPKQNSDDETGRP